MPGNIRVYCTLCGKPCDYYHFNRSLHVGVSAYFDEVTYFDSFDAADYAHICLKCFMKRRSFPFLVIR